MLFKITGALLAPFKLPFIIFTGDRLSAELFVDTVSTRFEGDVLWIRLTLLIDFPCFMFRRSSMLNLTIFGLTSSSAAPICRRELLEPEIMGSSEVVVLDAGTAA